MLLLIRVFSHGSIAPVLASYFLVRTMPKPHDAPLLNSSPDDSFFMVLYLESRPRRFQYASQVVVDQILVIVNEVYCQEADWPRIRQEAPCPI